MASFEGDADKAAAAAPAGAGDDEGEELDVVGEADEDEDAFIDPNDVIEEYEVGDEPPADSDSDAELPEAEGGAEASPPPPDLSSATFSGHEDVVYCVAVNPAKPTQFLTGGGDDRGFLWTLSAEGDIAECLELTGHTDTVGAVAFSSDGVLAATGGYDGKVQVWDSATGALKASLEGPDDIEWVTWHPKGGVVLAGGGDGTVWMWLASTGECMRVFAGHEGRVNAGAFTSSGKGVVTAGEDGTVRVWAPRTGECRHAFHGHGFHEGPVTCLAAHPGADQSHLLLSGSEDGTARLVHAQAKRVLGTFVHSERVAVADGGGGGGDGDSGGDAEEEGAYAVEAVGFCTVRPWIATGGADGVLKIWDMNSGLCRHACRHAAAVTRLRWHPHAPVVYTACADGAVRVWDALSGTCTHTLTGHRDMVLDLDVFAAGGGGGGGGGGGAGWVVSASDDGTAKVWSLDAPGGGGGGGGVVVKQVPAAAAAGSAGGAPPAAAVTDAMDL